MLTVYTKMDCLEPIVFQPPPQSEGYDYQFIEEPPDDLKCLICLCVARNPQQHGDGGCGKIFCTNCITKHKRTNQQCPHCRKPISTFKDNRSERDIQSLKIKCKHNQIGCEWMGELREMNKHLDTCGYVTVECPNECLDKTFSYLRKEIFLKDLQKHLAQECPHRSYNCPHCNEWGEFNKITSQEHTKVCLRFIIACPNAPNCELNFPRLEKHDHLSICEYQTVSCKYRELGCKKRLFRKHLQDHESDHNMHLSEAMATVLSLTKQCNLLRLQLYTKGDPAIVTKFKVFSFLEKKNHNIEFCSDPFYTHPHGYKLTISVHTNGAMDCLGTHVSVWVYLMRGEYDDQLEFPFKGTVTFELLNQLEDNNHHSYSDTEYGTERVTDGDLSDTPSGAIDFIPHEDLDYNNSKNCQYLKDDCLVFRVFANMLNYKPWLQCP